MARAVEPYTGESRAAGRNLGPFPPRSRGLCPDSSSGAAEDGGLAHSLPRDTSPPRGSLRSALQTPEQQEDEGDEEESPEGGEVALVAYQESLEVPQPGESALHLPTLRVARPGFRQAPSSPGTLPRSPLVGWYRRFYALRAQPLPKAPGVVGPVGAQLFWALLRPARSCAARNPHRLERGYGEFGLVVIGARQAEAYG